MVHVLKDYIILIEAENIGATLGVRANLPSNLKIFYLQLIPVAILLFLFRMILIELSIIKKENCISKILKTQVLPKKLANFS